MLLTPVRLILGRFKCFVQVLSNDPNIGIALTSKYSKYHDNLDIEAHQNSCHVITWHSSVHQIEFVFSCIFHPGISNPRFCHTQFSIPHRGHLMYLFSSRYFLLDIFEQKRCLICFYFLHRTFSSSSDHVCLQISWHKHEKILFPQKLRQLLLEVSISQNAHILCIVRTPCCKMGLISSHYLISHLYPLMSVSAL